MDTSLRQPNPTVVDDPLTTPLGDEAEFPSCEYASRLDATGYWFATAIVFAFLAAGVIVYRTGNPEIRTAANDIPPAAAQADPIQPQPMLQAR
jgi:hypothetical protein